MKFLIIIFLFFLSNNAMAAEKLAQEYDTKMPMYIKGKVKNVKVTAKTEVFITSGSKCPFDYSKAKIIFKGEQHKKRITNNYKTCAACPDNPKELCPIYEGILDNFFPGSIEKDTAYEGPFQKTDQYNLLDDGFTIKQLRLKINPVKDLFIYKFVNKYQFKTCETNNPGYNAYLEYIDCKNLTKGLTHVMQTATFETPFKIKLTSSTYMRVIKDKKLKEIINQMINNYQNIESDIDIITANPFKEKIKLISQKESKKINKGK